MFYLNLKKSKSGHPKMQNPITLYLKAKGIRTASPGNPYKRLMNLNDLNVSVGENENRKMVNKKLKKYQWALQERRNPSLPARLGIALLDKFPSCWYNYLITSKNLNVSIEGK